MDIFHCYCLNQFFHSIRLNIFMILVLYTSFDFQKCKKITSIVVTDII